VDANITDWLTVGTSIFYVNNNYDGGRANLTLAADMSPFGQEFDSNHNYTLLPMSTQSLYPNPLLNTTVPAERRGQNLNGDFYLELKPQFLKGFKYRLNAGYSSNPFHAASYTGRAQDDMLGTANISDTTKTSWIVENIVTYEKNIGNHHFDVTGLYSAQENQMFADGVTSVGFINDQLTFNNVGAGTTQSVSSGNTQQNYVSEMGRINYTYASKYLLTVTARRDGYSAFGANTSKFATFPSVAAGWNIAKESFFIPLRPILDPLKLRVSYGKSGNQAIPPYKTLSTQSVYQYAYNNNTIFSGVVPNQLGNSDLQWEYTLGLNLGLDFGLLKGRINGNVDVYDNKTSNLLLNRQLPAISGFTTILANIGQTENKGIEVTLKSFNIQTTDFSWETNINFAKNLNKWITIYGGNVNDLTNKWFIGKPVQAIYDYKMVGIWQVADAKLMARTDPGAKAGDLRMADVNGDSVINANDKIYLGTPFPTWTGGMTNTFRYKNLRLNIFIQTSQGGLKNNPNLDFADQAQNINLPASVGYWTPSNPVNNRPSLRIGANAKGYGYPSDDSFTRIKDVTLSYTVPQSILNKWKLAELTFYISGRNLYTFSNWKGWDPENNYTAGYTTNFNNYPDVASYVFGINLAIR
jgi:TonB-linked SusC/RagA family outer membrane protein